MEILYIQGNKLIKKTKDLEHLSKEERAKTIISLVQEMKKHHFLIIDDKPYSYAIFPEFIADTNKDYEMNMEDIWNALASDLTTIFAQRVNALNREMPSKVHNNEEV